MTLKTLGSENVTIRPFRVHKSQALTYISGSGVFAEMNVAMAKRFPLVTTFASGTILSGLDSGTAIILTQSVLELNDFETATSPTSEDGTFQEPLFGTVQSMFYTSGAESGSATFAAAGDGIRNFPLSESAYIINVAQRLFGEGIRPGTFVVSTPAAGSGTIVDNSRGRLFVSGTDGSLNVVGNVFYNLGIAVINRLESVVGSELIQETGMFFPDASTLRVAFDATLTLFEYTIIASLDPFEFNFSNSPSWFKTADSSEKILDLVESGTVSPYVTSIGLYNDKQQLVAVAKLPRPLRRLVTSQQSFIIRFDI